MKIQRITPENAVCIRPEIFEYLDEEEGEMSKRNHFAIVVVSETVEEFVETTPLPLFLYKSFMSSKLITETKEMLKYSRQYTKTLHQNNLAQLLAYCKKIEGLLNATEDFIKKEETQLKAAQALKNKANELR